VLEYPYCRHQANNAAPLSANLRYVPLSWHYNQPSAIARSIPAGSRRHCLLLQETAHSPAKSGTRAYVTNEGSGTVSVIDTATNSVVASVNIGSEPTDNAISPDGKHVYASNNLSGTVSVIDTATNSVTATINVGANPYGVVVSPDGSHAYVATYSGNVEIIDTATNSVTGSIAVGPAVGIAISSDGAHLYVSHTASNTVSVIDTTTDAVVDTITVEHGPEYLALAPAPVAPPAPHADWRWTKGRLGSCNQRLPCNIRQ
jgi:YVTN family beta-propeller protein